ncbi:MAG: hypothetical protein DRP28_03250, partial [Thermodesulfobacteriota bacterium]
MRDEGRPVITVKLSRILCKYSVNPLYPALKRLPFSGFQSSLIADRRASAIWPAIETLQKANRSCGRGHGWQPFTGRGYFFEQFNGSPR